MDYKSLYAEYKTKYIELKNDENYNILNGGGKKKRKNKNKKMLSRQTITEYTEHISEPWFTLISLGLKTVEGRKNKGKFKEMQVGDIITWVNNDFLERKIKTKIVRKAEYRTFEEYLNTEGLNDCLPGMPTIEHGLSVYFKYFTKEDEATFGVIAIQMELV